MTKIDTEGRIKVGTVNTPDLEKSVADYQKWLGYEVVEQATLSADMATHLQAPAMAGRRYAVMQPASGTPIFIRFIEGTPVPDNTPLRSYGWASLEITVQDCDGLHEDLKNSPFEVIGEPALLDFTDKIYPMQVLGIAGEVLYLNEVRGSLPDYDLPIAQSPVDHIFITILATPDMQQGVDYYVSQFGWQQGNSYDVPYSVINKAFDLPESTTHKLSMNCVGRLVNNEVDQYPDGTANRPVAVGELPPGVAMISFISGDISKTAHAPLSVKPGLQGPIYAGRTSAIFTGKAGELIEIIEDTSA